MIVRSVADKVTRALRELFLKCERMMGRELKRSLLKQFPYFFLGFETVLEESALNGDLEHR